jgi:hypothetical protein
MEPPRAEDDSGSRSRRQPETVGMGGLAVLLYCAMLSTILLTGPSLRAAKTLPPRLYEITTEIVMPHLEENLRYATTRDTRCLAHQELSSAFPILAHPALADCRLERESRREDGVSYILACAGGHGTTGGAVWRIGEREIKGTLSVTLGGKNVTFQQRVTARPLGDCDEATP